MWAALSSIFRKALNVLGLGTMVLGYFGDVLQVRVAPHVLIAAGKIAFLIGMLWTMKVQRDKRDRAERDLKTRIKDLEDKLSPKLEIVFGQGPPFEEQEIWAGSEEVQRRWFRIGVKNASIVTINDVVVRLEKLFDLSSDPPGKSPVPPIVLRQMNDDPIDRQHRQGFTLHPGSTQFIEVVWKPEADLTADTDEIRLGYAQTAPAFIPCRRHELFIEATGRDVPAKGRWFFVDVDSNGGLLFGPRDEG
jgi:hypothetical protein